MKKSIFALGAAALVALMVVAPNAHGQTPPPPPPPGGNPTATATATPLPTATATPVPMRITLSVAHARVKAGQTQKATVSTLAGASISLSVTYPNGKKDSIQGSAGSSGQLTYSFAQPSGVTKGNKRTVTVKASADYAGLSKHSTKKYTII